MKFASRFSRAFGILLIGLAAVGQEAVFRTDTRLVEVYATVKDHRGKYLSGLTADQFEIRDEGALQPVVAFEADTSPLSCALLLDTTGSMQAALPVVKNAVAAFAEALRPDDAVAVYSFSTSLNLLQDFTRDRASIRRAVLRTRASGQTALFDAIAQLGHDISSRHGKKVIVVFTDGDDNASVLRAASAITRAKKSGIPVYTVAEGDALKNHELLSQLRTIALGAGGQFYEAKKNGDIATIFQDILENLQHTYLLAYKPPAAESGNWRTIRLALKGVKDYRCNAKEGYYPD